MHHISRKAALAFGPLVLLGVVSLACGGTTSPTQVVVQATIPPVVSTVQIQAPELTSTPKPTAIPPTETPALPTTTPTPNVPPLEILSHQGYIDGKWSHIVGEVRNNTDAPMEYVKIVSTLYDSNNKVVGTDFAYTE